MPNLRAVTNKRTLLFMSGLLILKVNTEVMLGYRNYWPPDFNSDFLRGREQYFFGFYYWAFQTHISSGPITLFLGVLLISDRFRLRFPQWHRVLGRIQVACILFLVTPSGLWMAKYAAAGTVASIAFAILALLTGLCAALGWRAATQRRFIAHRLWMWRSFLLLCSAVVIRVLGGLATVTSIQTEWFDPLTSWISWIVPLTIFEWFTWQNRKTVRTGTNSMPNLYDG